MFWLRFVAAFPRALVLLLALTALVPAGGQTFRLAEPRSAADNLASVLEQGARLERERRWAEALSHYEEALRRHPERADLRERVALARAHYEVCRRYSDPAFLAALQTLSTRDALAIYEEVLLKIQSHFVQEPSWPRIVRGAALSVNVAVTEPAFASRHLAGLPVSRLVDLQTDVDALAASAVADRHQASQRVQQLASTLSTRYGVPPSAVVLECVSGAVAALDEYSSFLTGSQMDELFSQIEGNFVGIGVELKTEPEGLAILSVIPGGPADLAGLRPGDWILSVDGAAPPATASSTLADMLRGVEGSQVRVGVRQPDGSLHERTITRRRVEIPSVEEVQMLDPQYGIAYFKLTSFQKTTSRDVDAALWKLHRQGMRQLILDLRGNPGGLLKAAVDVADKFVYDGLIVATRGRSPREDFDHRGEVAGTWRVPLIVLIDHDSASASEILAGAIRDHRRGTVIGQRSYGKGSVQGIFPLATANLGLRLTTAQWYTPSGRAISGGGIAPDILVPLPAAGGPLEAASPGGQQAVVALRPPQASSASAAAADPVLETALRVARAQGTSRTSAP
jgi:carboxyl-terminal processing protease